MYNFPQVSLLITHYNRSKSLENLLNTFGKLNCKFGEIIISDDGSSQEHLNYIKNVLSKQYVFKLIMTHANKGLGNNINKGQDAVTMPYTLYIQEDFEPGYQFPKVLQQSIHYMNEDSSLDIVRFYAYDKYPYLKPYKDDVNFSLMYIPFFALNYKKIYYYSDHPHLRRASFIEKFDRYKEGVKGDKTEYNMCISFIQKKGRGLFYNAYSTLFIQKNTDQEPSTMQRVKWRASNNFIIKQIRDVYRQIKYNFDIFFLK